MAFPNEVPDIDQIKKRIKDDHDDGAAPCPDLASVTREEITELFEADESGTSVLTDHNTYLPMACPEMRRRPPLPGLTHSAHTLQTAYPGMTAAQHTARCTRSVHARQGQHHAVCEGAAAADRQPLCRGSASTSLTASRLRGTRSRWPSLSALIAPRSSLGRCCTTSLISSIAAGMGAPGGRC